MKIPSNIIYGIRLLSLLSKIKKRVNTTNLSNLLGISSLYLRQLAMPLEKKNFIKSFRGRYGGYILIKSPDKIKIINVFNAYGETLTLLDCLSSNSNCKNIKDCETRKLVFKISNTIKTFLKNTTIADINNY